MKFPSDCSLLEAVNSKLDHKDVPQFYRADMEFGRLTGNQNFNLFLDQMDVLFKDDGFKYTSIDCRTHMLMKDMFPCIPGWHCDDFYRPTGQQPDLMNVVEKAPMQHYCAIIGECSRTELAHDDLVLPDHSTLPTEKPQFLYYDQIIQEMKPKSFLLKEQNIYKFGPLHMHRGSAATENGWRTFIRITRSNHHMPENQIRYQSNVYLVGDVSW